MTGWNLPPGVTENMLPGNEPDDEGEQEEGRQADVLDLLKAAIEQVRRSVRRGSDIVILAGTSHTQRNLAGFIDDYMLAHGYARRAQLLTHGKWRVLYIREGRANHS